MATWQEWVSDKVKDSLNSREKNDYMNLVPRRNPQDPADEAIRAGAGAVGRSYMAGTLMEPGAPPPASAVPELRTEFAAPHAIDPNRPTMEQSIGAARQSLGIPMPEAISTDEAIARRFGPAPPPAAPLAAVPQTGTAAEGFYHGSTGGIPPSALPQEETGGLQPTPSIRGGNPLTRWDLARGLSQNGINVPTMSREEMVAALKQAPGVGGIANVGTMPDKQLRDLMDQRGLSYFKMTDDQMRKAYAPYDQGAGGGGRTSYAVPPEKAQAYEARLRDLNAKGMKSDQALNQAAQEFGLTPEAQPAGGRTTPALFTMGDFGAGSPEPPSYKQALQTALQMFTDYAKNPEKYGPHYAQNIINAIQHLPVSEAVPETAAAEQEYKRAGAEYSRAHAGLVPSQIEQNLAHARNIEKSTKQTGVTLAPGTQHYVPGTSTGDPWTKVAEGAAERPATEGTPVKMSEQDKADLAGAWHAYSQEMDPKEKRKLEMIIEGIRGKYAPAGPAGPKPPVPGARLAKHPTTGAPVWVGPDNKVLPTLGEEAVPTEEKGAKGKKTMWEHLNAPAPGLSMLQALIGQ